MVLPSLIPMRLTLRSLLPFAILLTAVTGCKHPEEQIVGNWDSPQGPAEFKSDNTFVTGKEPKISSGKWTLTDINLVLTYDKVDGVAVDEFIKQKTAEAVKRNPKAGDPKAVERLKKATESKTYTLDPEENELDPNVPVAGGAGIYKKILPKKA